MLFLYPLCILYYGTLNQWFSALVSHSNILMVKKLLPSSNSYSNKAPCCGENVIYFLIQGRYTQRQVFVFNCTNIFLLGTVEFNSMSNIPIVSIHWKFQEGTFQITTTEDYGTTFPPTQSLSDNLKILVITKECCYCFQSAIHEF